jgi:hypothetical protein
MSLIKEARSIKSGAGGSGGQGGPGGMGAPALRPPQEIPVSRPSQ